MSLLKKEEGRVPLTTFQALGDMYTRYDLYLPSWLYPQSNRCSACVMGKDRLGWQYLVETADCMNQVMRKQQKMILDAKEQSKDMEWSINIAFSGLSSFIPWVNYMAKGEKYTDCSQNEHIEFSKTTAYQKAKTSRPSARGPRS